MMDQVIRKLKQPWDFMRILRVVFGGYIVGAGLFDAQYFGLFIGGFLLYQGIMNIGCFGASCVPRSDIKQSDDSGEMQFEEIKQRT